MNILGRLARKLFFPGAQVSYSQFGEDLIVGYLFDQLQVRLPTYLDVGANHPRFISNTYSFYARGSRGVLVEPNPRLCKLLRLARPGDTLVEAGIGLSGQTHGEFFIFGGFADGLSTFSREEATHWETVGLKGVGRIPVERVVSVPLIPIDRIIAENFCGKPPNFLSLDVEGLDLEVLKGIDFSRHSPDVICVETLGYDERQETFKKNDIIDFVLSKQYFVYADTRVNTIFCRAALINR